MKRRKQTFGQWLRKHRKLAGYSLRGFAELIGENAQNLCAIEASRRNPPTASLDKLHAIADALRVPRDEVCAAAGIIPPDIEITLACNPALWPKVRRLYS